jgi:exopolyphosphatase/guanosine-5'-triphosphate,3'-diphosphate pyrophosphatase
MDNQNRASIDIGSNSVLLLIANISNQQPVFLDSQSRITSLGRDLDRTKFFHIESLKLTYEALEEFKAICLKHNIPSEQIIITATEASRVAANAKDFYLKIKNELSMNVKIINSVAEAYYSAKGVLFPGTFSETKIHVLDLGGASSELIRIDTSSNNVDSSFSMPVGGVRATDWLNSGDFDKQMQMIHNSYKQEINANQTNLLYFVGGTITSISCMVLKLEHFKEEIVNHSKLNLTDLTVLETELKDHNSNQSLSKYPFLGKRSESIHGGLKAIIQICDWLSTVEIEVLTYGLRYGTLLEGEIKNEFIIK